MLREHLSRTVCNYFCDFLCTGWLGSVLIVQPLFQARGPLLDPLRVDFLHVAAAATTATCRYVTRSTAQDTSCLPVRVLLVRSLVAQRTDATPRQSSRACRMSVLSRMVQPRQPQDCRMWKYCVQGIGESTNMGSVSLPYISNT